MRILAFSALAAGVIVVTAFVAYALGRKHVRDRYEIWYSSSATFEARLVDASQMAIALVRMHEGDIDGAEYVLLSRIKNDLDVVHALLPLAPERDKAMADGVITYLSEEIGDQLPVTNAASSDYRSALRQSTALNVKRQLEFLIEAKTIRTNIVTP